MVSVLTEMNLFVGQERLLLQPIAASSEVIVIDRLTHETRVTSFDPSLIPMDSERKLVFGIMGTIRLIAGPYLILVTSVTKMGEISGQPVWRIDRTELMPHTKTTRHLTEDQVRFNATYLSMVRSVLDTESFYFCNSYDLTHTAQRLSQQAPGFQSMSLFDRSDKRFVWNAALLSDWNSRPELKKFCVPIVHGFIAIRNVQVNGFTFRWILISRRDIRRAGCRLFMRGSDRQSGHVANFVETEQLIEYSDPRIPGSSGRCSFVQVRGSIPLIWSQSPNLRYKPPPVPTAGPADQVQVFAKHMDDVTSTYGPVVLINLINQTGAEGRMEQEFASTVRSVGHPLVRYEAFDFHQECRKMRWDRLSILMDRVSRDQEEIGFFQSTRSPGGQEDVVQRLQKGIFRTNCIDSLDRTNVVQGLLARRSLEHQLIRLSVLSPGQSVSDQRDFESVYRNVWADNADTLSLQYSGTGALKTDFTRTGKRTTVGAIRDGVHSLTRYYKNNLTDGFRQDAIDLFLGLHVVDPGLPCPLDRHKDWKFAALPLILLGSVAMFFFSILLPIEHGTETLAYLLFWSAMAGISVSVILYYGQEFVDFPRLRPHVYVTRTPHVRSSHSESRLLHQDT